MCVGLWEALCIMADSIYVVVLVCLYWGMCIWERYVLGCGNVGLVYGSSVYNGVPSGWGSPVG